MEKGKTLNIRTPLAAVSLRFEQVALHFPFTLSSATSAASHAREPWSGIVSENPRSPPASPAP